MGFVDMNPGNLAGTLILVLLLAALLPALNTGVNQIVSNTSGITAQMALLIVPVIIIAILANLWTSDRGRR